MTETETSNQDLLVREGDIAGDYLETLLDIADVDGDIDMDVEGDRAMVAIVGDGLDALVGPNGATLDALQELTRLAVVQQTGVRSRLMLDIGGWRAKRKTELTEVGNRAAQRVLESGEPARLWERHLLNCAGVAELLEPGQLVLDLGSGAGLPGLVLGVLREDVTIELVEPLLRRATFLTEAVEELGLPHVSVRRARGEELAGSVLADVVTARAVAPLDRLGGWALPLLRAGGRLLALKGESADSELATSRPALRKAGAESAEVVTVGNAEQLTEARVVVVVRGPGAVDRRRVAR